MGESGHVTGVDLAENLLHLARQKAENRGLQNIGFVNADMCELPYPDETFDAVVCVFGIFFVKDMEGLINSLFRLVKPGGKLAVTSWGDNLFSPVYEQWRDEVRKLRPDLYAAFNPWDRIREASTMKELFLSQGINDVTVIDEKGNHFLRDASDWWTIVMGSGFRWTVEQLGKEHAEIVKQNTLQWLRTNNITSIQTNVLYAIASK